MTAQQLETLQSIRAAMPQAQPPLGQRPNWGPPGNRERAYYLAALLGHQYDPKCQSCDADVWDALRQHLPK